MPLDLSMGDGSKIVLRLSTVYFTGVLIILTVGLALVIYCMYLFVAHFKKLNSVFLSYSSVLIPDLSIAANFLFRDLHNISVGRLQPGAWCKFSGFVALSAMTAYNVGSVCISYTTYRMVIGKPLTVQQVFAWNVVSWVTGLFLAAIYFYGDLIGPYKGLYCCIKETQYRAYAVAPGFVVLFTAIYFMIYYYYEAYIYIKQAESRGAGGKSGGGGSSKASKLILRRAAFLVSAFYVCWSVMLVNGFITSFHVQVHPGFDILAAWLAKLLPAVDSLFLLQMFGRITNPKSTASDTTNRGSAASSGNDSV